MLGFNTPFVPGVADSCMKDNSTVCWETGYFPYYVDFVGLSIDPRNACYPLSGGTYIIARVYSLANLANCVLYLSMSLMYSLIFSYTPFGSLGLNMGVVGLSIMLNTDTPPFICFSISLSTPGDNTSPPKCRYASARLLYLTKKSRLDSLASCLHVSKL